MFRLIAVAFGLALGVVIAECAIRVTGVASLPMSKRYLRNLEDSSGSDYQCYPSNPHGEFSSPPDLSRGSWKLIDYAKREFPLSAIKQTPWCVRYVRGRTGMRGRDVSLAPLPGRLRIALVGDSFVFGEGVPQSLTLVDQMARRWGDRFELLNGGVPGINTQQELRDARFFVENLHCERIIVVFNANDITLTNELALRQNHINDLINVRDLHFQMAQHRAWFMRYSQLARFAGSRLLMRRVTEQTIAWYLDCYNPSLNAANLAQLAADLGAFARLPHCRAVLVLYPLLEGLEGDYPLEPIHVRVAAMARDAGLPVLDLAATFRGKSTKQFWAHDCDHHPNGRAHAIAAEAIANWLRHDVPGFLAPPESAAP